MAAYYPRRVARFADLQKAYPGFETYDDFEEDRIESVAITKSRGKGAPKKKRTAAGKWDMMRERGKRMVLMVMQSLRSLARRRGKRWIEGCFAIYPTKARAMARACKNTHGHMDSKSRAEEALGFYKERGVLWSSMGAHSHIWRRTGSSCTKKPTFKHHTLEPETTFCEVCSSVAQYCLSSTVKLRSKQDHIVWEEHITTQRNQGHRQTLD
jgi:hypothetical protein